MENADSADKKWYQNSDDEQDDSGGATFSPSHISSATSPICMTAPLQPVAARKNHRRGSSEGRTFQISGRAGRGEQHRPNYGYSSEEAPRHQPITRTASAKLPHVVRVDSQVDGNQFSRSPSDGRVKRAGPKPPVPPKKKRPRSKSAGSKPQPSITAAANNARAGLTGSSRRVLDDTSVVSDQRKSNDSSSNGVISTTSLESYSSGQSPASLTSQGSRSGPANHDYAILEQPPDHDYAILDPEYHEEFYGKYDYNLSVDSSGFCPG